MKKICSKFCSYENVRIFVRSIRHKTLKKNAMKTLKINSRLDNTNGYLITKKEYQVTILKQLKYNYVLIKIGEKMFKTDLMNIK